jgi:hypothetical protein
VALFKVGTRLDPKNRKISGKIRKTVTRTFRIREEWDDVLREEAEKQGVSVNILMNLILRKYALFDRWARGYNVVSLTQQALREVLASVPLENLALAGEKSGASDIQDILDTMGLPSNYNSFTYLASNYFGSSDYASWFSCHHHFHENCDFFHLQHNLGQGWSVFLQKYFLSYLKILKIDCETKVYDYAVNIRVPRTR